MLFLHLYVLLDIPLDFGQKQSARRINFPYRRLDDYSNSASGLLIDLLH